MTEDELKEIERSFENAPDKDSIIHGYGLTPNQAQRLVDEVRRLREIITAKDEILIDIKDHTIKEGHCVGIEEDCEKALALSDTSWASTDPMKCDFSTKDSDKFKIGKSPDDKL